MSAFAGCPSFEFLLIPDSVASIGLHAFDGVSFYDSEGRALLPNEANPVGKTFSVSDGTMSVIIRRRKA